MIKKIMMQTVRYIYNMPLKRKLLLSYYLLIITPLILLTVISYRVVSSGFESEVLYSASKSYDQAKAFLDFKINSLISATDIIYFNSDIQTILSRNKQNFQNDIIQQNMDFVKLSSFLGNFDNDGDIYRAGIYVPGWLLYSNQNVYFYNMEDFKRTAVYNKLMLSNSKVLWLQPQFINDANGSSISVITLLRKIRNNNHLNEIIGIIKVNTLESNIKDIITKASTAKNGVVFLKNSEGDIISCSSEDALKRYDLNDLSTTKLIDKDVSWKTVDINKNDFIIKSSLISNTDWTMVDAIPYTEITSQSNYIKNIMILLMLVLGAVACIPAYFISSSSINRIILLTNKMKKVEEGELEISLPSKSKDEIWRLFESFNFMVKRIKILMEEQFKTGKELKNAELRALQAQINPHFLYNTLDLINWKAIDNDIPEIAEITLSLAKYYKLSLNKGKDIVSIKDEIDHAMTYIQIQNLRYDNRIDFIVDIDEAIYSCSILKIILQPIVENSILHGILENRKKAAGTIKISGSFDGNSICLEISDDGVGISEEKLAEIFLKSSNNGYGVKNINNRIKLYYGEQYGLSFKSAVGIGTTVYIRFPAVKYRNDNS